tara:strand:+ start:166574 stop:166735 length:162 start_codon:yes stop_codon:yes gene_type:complete
MPYYWSVRQAFDVECLFSYMGIFFALAMMTSVLVENAVRFKEYLKQCDEQVTK